ncbi:MAG TPA: Kazal-type serine protease inhibitor domain-containing protein [Candidatus Paceibacterota bacterium]
MNMRNTVKITTVLGALFFVALTVLAAEDYKPLNLAQLETITSQELGVDNPGILPGNPFYFLKEWSRGVRRVFTFDPVARVEYELRIANQKAAEAKKIEEVKPEDTEAIMGALQNYQEAQERLKDRLEALEEKSQNPEIDNLLNKVTDRSVQHQKVFDEIAQKFEKESEIHDLVNETQGKIDDATIAAAAKGDPVEFASKLEKALISSKGSELKHIRSVEILDRLEQKAPDDLRDALNKMRNEFSIRLEQDIQELLKTENSQSIESAVQALPGDNARRLILLDEIRTKAEFRVAETLGRVADLLEKSTIQEKDIAEKAKEQIKRALEVISETEKKLIEGSYPEETAKKLLLEAQENVKEAQLVFASGKYGEAFGHARSAEVLARSALRFISKLENPVEDIKTVLNELSSKIEKYAQLVQEKGYTEEKNPKVFALLADAKKHLELAREALEKNDAASARLHTNHVREYLYNLSRLIEMEIRGVKPLPVSVTPVYPEPVICTKEYKPVCAANGKTYGNACQARVAKVVVIHEGTCESAIKPPSEPTEPPQLCTLEYNPVCGADGNTYSNRCFAKAAKIEVAREGMCEVKSAETGASVLDESMESGQVEATTTAAIAIDPLLHVSVIITENGQFDPAEIKVRKGGKVTWVNKGKLFVWPASNDHPSHQMYSGFDAFKGIGNGESYSFMFEKIGTWPYHDHLNPSVSGKIIVVE